MNAIRTVYMIDLSTATVSHWYERAKTLKYTNYFCRKSQATVHDSNSWCREYIIQFFSADLCKDVANIICIYFEFYCQSSFEIRLQQLSYRYYTDTNVTQQLRDRSSLLRLFQVTVRLSVHCGN